MKGLFKCTHSVDVDFEELDADAEDGWLFLYVHSCLLEHYAPVCIGAIAIDMSHMLKTLGGVEARHGIQRSRCWKCEHIWDAVKAVACSNFKSDFMSWSRDAPNDVDDS